MSTLQPWISDLGKAVRLGLQGLYKEPPMTAVQWADEHFYMSSESSYHEGKWTTDPFQVAILNAMGNDLIAVVNFVKSARIGYTKLLMANIGYKLQHKRRNIVMWSPTDTDSKGISKRHVDGLIRDVPVIKDLAPWFGKKHRDNTIEAKTFSNRKSLWIRGGTASGNYRELSADETIYDELSNFDPDIEGEGDAVTLGDKRLDGATYPKSIRGSTPKKAGSCQINKAAEESPIRLRFYVACPHCQHEQTLKFGGKDCGYGLKWEKDELGQATKAWYVCECCAENFYHQDMVAAAPHGRWICDVTGIWTRDSMDWFDKDDQPIRTPKSVAFYCWAIYSTWSAWLKIAEEWLKIKGDREKLITFTNTTLGEMWEEVQSKVDWEELYGRREVWTGQVPQLAVVLTGFIDTQDDRLEGRVWAFGQGEEAWLVYRFILMGDPASEELQRKAGIELQRQFTRADGLVMKVDRWGWDSGGHYTDEVYAASRKHGLLWVIPTKGASQYGKPIANMPRTKNKAKVYLTEIGTDNAKELIYSRLKLPVDTAKSQAGVCQPGVIHLPANGDICDESEVRQLTSEVKVPKVVNGLRVHRWDAQGRRNEALDCLVGAIAALRISQQRFGLDLDALAVKPEPGGEAAIDNTKERPRAKSSYWKKN
ncbi:MULTISPECIES: phage terminase large subunit family protein [unclassified Pseudomonas]|uniref:phage terminase large subunit family protein n=1 Tax=unclassified Pseudomonas TaxID=196821 RepID=UPI000DA7992A|nr:MULTISPECIES: terminase gpA endonuclease subunit [unclassified Pseudomonas]MDW3716713.1 terminase gpA endonuclease subunit [Pseudomonas sp. 2023EL-01195]PZE12707.1 phage terminase large subunit family protein [Pseudomonas sp. 57B-090624]